jgi:predicted nucleotidyltransferase
MNLLAEMLSSRSRAEFFRILFGVGSNEFHLREIERRSGLAIGTIRQEASKLERLGLIIKRKDGNRTYFSANQTHPLYKTIHELVLKTSGLAEILIQALSTEEIKFAFIFGSIAAGEENAESDLDLFIIGKIGLRSLSKLLKAPGEKIGREINPHIMSADEFLKRKKEKEHFVSQVLESPKLMIKGSEDEFSRMGE